VQPHARPYNWTFPFCRKGSHHECVHGYVGIICATTALGTAIEHMFQKDGAPPHWSLLVRHFLNICFPGCWIGQDGPIPCPPWSSDLTLLEFFLWDYVKDVTHTNPITNIQNLCNRIANAILMITPYMLEHTQIKTDYRLDIIEAIKGAHVETV
jgi:hypothetical protein